MQKLIEHYTRLLANTQLDKKRYLIGQIQWEHRLIGLTGPRGAGKTTLILQRIKEARLGGSALYVSLDNLYFAKNTLSDMAHEFYLGGGSHLFLDEVHRYPNWAIEIKNLYDSYPSLNIVFTGSSILEIYKAQADLSRRSVMYALPGLSFREFLYFEDLAEFPALTLEDIIAGHAGIAAGISSKMRIIPAFRAYLQHGYYPFYKEGLDAYFDKLSGIINVILENDLPAIVNLQNATIYKIKRLLAHVATMVPFTPNINELSGLIETDRKSLLGYLEYLERAELLRMLYGTPGRLSSLAKPAKLFTENANLLFALSNNTQSGTLRETFFANQLSQCHTLSIPAAGDFLVDETWLFEVGGKGKTFRQIKNAANSFIAYDDMEIGMGNKIPLWLFGFLY
jgi:predicted AAA+ superfamily ATPase